MKFDRESAVRIGVGLFAILGPGFVLFTAAGRFDIPRFWAYLAVLGGSTITILAIISRDLLDERIQPKSGGVDRHLRWLNVVTLSVTLAVAGLDVGRFHWSDTIPEWLSWTGLGLMLAAFSIGVSAVLINRFFSPVVRIQSERGHVVVDRGPYAWVRHPGYACWLIGMPASALLLGSWSAGVLFVIPISLLIRRMLIEDRFLHENLPGYAAYAARVRWRLIPFIY